MSGIEAAPDAGKKVNEIAIGLKGSKHKLYIITCEDIPFKYHDSTEAE